jgi:hypothetical protein
MWGRRETMANWQRTIKLQPEWGKADRREITAQDLARSIASKLRIVADLRLPELNDERDFIADEFAEFAADNTGDFDDLDELMERLYDWGDTHIGGKFFDAKKVCWIDTISPASPPAALSHNQEPPR